ncbi:MAG: hypothetical protein HY542_02510 [Deltaproteobacteria bacterium]|nr:hypothetical protein [Deltaproteobacteria bacterium]
MAETGDQIANVSSIIALIGGGFEKIQGFIRTGQNSSRFAPRPLFTLFGLLGMAGMVWNVGRAVERLKEKNCQSLLQTVLDTSLVVGGLFTFGNIGSGLLRTHLAVPQLLRLQNLAVTGNLVADGVASAALVSDFSVDPTGDRAVSVLFQVGLTVLFGFNRPGAMPNLKSGQIQRFFIDEFHSQAVAAGQRVGPEIEFGFKTPKSREEIVRAIKTRLESKGWQTELSEAPPLQLGSRSKAYPGLIAEFEYGGRRYKIENLQMSGDSLLFVWRDGEGLPIRPPLNGAVDRPAADVLRTFNQNQRHAVRETARLISREKGVSIATIESEINRKLNLPGAIRYTECSLKDSHGNFIKCNYDPERGKFLFVSARIKGRQGEAAAGLPGTYATLDEAYLDIRRLIQGDELRLIQSDRYTGIKARKGGRELELEVAFEAFGEYEIMIHRMVAGELDDEFLHLSTKAVAGLGADGTGSGHYVSQQLNIGMVDEKITARDLDFGPTVRTAQEFFRMLGQIEPGMTPSRIRHPFVSLPKSPLASGSEGQRVAAALTEITGPGWDRGPGEAPLAHFLRVSERINELTPSHGGRICFDGVVSFFAKKYLASDLPIDAATRSRLILVIRSPRENPYPVIEMRLNDSPEVRTGGGLRLSPDGVLWNHRFWTSFLYACKTGGIDSPRVRRFLEAVSY